jgi:hypothetical protein
MRSSTFRLTLGQAALFAAMLTGVAPVQAQLRPEAGALEAAPQELVDRIEKDPIAYFRFVNRPWVGRVCELFAGDLRDLPVVRLHGDAHVEQFAVTSTAWGLDDFDDSARGPALVDMVRLLGSIDLVARQRGWSPRRPALFDRFFAGYRKGLDDPDALPPRPAVVVRLRAIPTRSPTAFLAWGETMMQPLAAESAQAVVAAMNAIAAAVYAEKPELPRGYLTVVRAGRLQMGIGSALTPKVLMRIQGPTDAPDDDELVEAKQQRDLGGLACLEAAPQTQAALRVVLGARQMGRLSHHVLAAGPSLIVPELAGRGRRLHDWWIRNWEASYRELEISDLRVVEDLSDVAYDAGIQLGAGSLRESAEYQSASARKRAVAQLTKLEPRIRDAASTLVDELLLGWNELGSRR